MEVISAFLSVVIEAVANGDKVTLIGFGSFERCDHSQREGRNPKTNEPMTIPATIVPAFSACYSLKKKLHPNQYKCIYFTTVNPMTAKP
ncbi:MAG: HU family DNA-binding protein [Nostoc sp.]